MNIKILNKRLALIVFIILSIFIISGCDDKLPVQETVTPPKQLEENRESKIIDKKASPDNVEQVDIGLEEEKMKKEGDLNEEENLQEDLTEGDGKTVEGPYRNGLEISRTYGNGEYIFRLPNDDNNFEIFYKTKNSEEEVYDTVYDERHDAIVENRFLSQFYVKDNDDDGIEELYLFFEDFFELQMILVLRPINDSHQLHSTFFGHGQSMFEYEDINEDGVPDLISPHPGGGGTTTTWKGLDLVNVYNPENLNYEFSYKMTRKKYEDRHEKLTLELTNYASPENWEALLESSADLGLVKECEEQIEKSKSLEELNVHPDWQGPYDTYFEYVIARAKEYKNVWEDLKESDATEKR
ncbi:hypothetical protein [Vallitalea maricola]|uniref:Uncharacterized protein n=1 Tax=Vallitalea maricola TaxID=3074433 RepID=A0ACB5UMQ9_9FIRM|nr:hypothetical protein AN2V17_30540 [Vallitalea sp. AN17-2]